MKKYFQFIKEMNDANQNLNPRPVVTKPDPQIKLTNFSQLQEFQYIKLYNRGKEVGNFSIEQVYNSNPEITGFDNIVVQKINDDGTFDITNGHFVIKIEDPDYTFQVLEKKHSAGIVFVYKGKLLLVHHIMDGKGYTHPKGNCKPGEKYEETAHREVVEEIGVNFPIELLIGKPIHSLQYFGTTYLRTQHFYIIHLTPEEYKKYINYDVIPKENLQLNEIDWAGFVPIEKCKEILQKGYDVILKYVN